MNIKTLIMPTLIVFLISFIGHSYAHGDSFKGVPKYLEVSSKQAFHTFCPIECVKFAIAAATDQSFYCKVKLEDYNEHKFLSYMSSRADIHSGYVFGADNVNYINWLAAELVVLLEGHSGELSLRYAIGKSIANARSKIKGECEKIGGKIKW